ncbi:hypothetical protein CEXT_38931 [Caerostris extrusa]|uniref:Uncharacterized protein n=1 Tax=Caerostris extrusa TaxID=172846 RepID=A0AAV4P390_CAEEX|nr:hypothetical protein CEXT_38931 [Caerostris extrusa]
MHPPTYPLPTHSFPGPILFLLHRSSGSGEWRGGGRTQDGGLQSWNHGKVWGTPFLSPSLLPWNAPIRLRNQHLYQLAIA